MTRDPSMVEVINE